MNWKDEIFYLREKRELFEDILVQQGLPQEVGSEKQFCQFVASNMSMISIVSFLKKNKKLTCNIIDAQASGVFQEVKEELFS